MIHAPRLQASPVLAPALSPRLQRAVRLLQMSSLDFAQLLRETLQTNPFLELDEDGGPPDGQEADASADTDAPEPEALAAQTDWDAGWTGTRRGEPDNTGAFDTLVAPTTLAAHLSAQLTVMPLNDRDRALALAVAHSLDGDGYLRTPLAEVGVAAALRPPAQAPELAIALRHVQALEPAGVAARNLAECLLLQLAQLPPAGEPDLRACRQLATSIVRHHLQTLASHDLGALARRLHATREAISAACNLVCRLDPRPGWRHGEHAVHYLVPDVVVRRHRGEWIALLNPAVIPRVRLNRCYAQWFNQHREPHHGPLGAHLQEARWTVRNVEQRFATILSVARAILQRQHRFLAYGALAMKPLALREIADAVGVHESTVSRVTNNKFMATPCGVFELKYFFSRSLATASGGECSPTAIRSLIQEMIAAESPARPLSDVALADQLARQGLRVARRTVTKYRQQLRIAPAPRRQTGIR